MRPRHWLHFVSDLAGAGLVHLAAAGRMTRPVRALETLWFVLFWGALAAGAWRFHLIWALALWIASIATAFWSGVRLRIFTEHLGTRDTHRISMGRLFETVVMPHSIGLHWEHHHFPGVPFHRLRELRAAIPAPPIVPLSALFARFAAAPSVRSGEIVELGAAQGPLRVDTGPIERVP
jgi:fatty acid desaturase